MTKEEIYHQECKKDLPDGIYPGMDRDKHLNAMSEYAKQEAMAFGEWVMQHYYCIYPGYYSKFPKSFEPVGTGYPIAHLYTLYLNQH